MIMLTSREKAQNSKQKGVLFSFSNFAVFLSHALSSEGKMEPDVKIEMSYAESQEQKAEYRSRKQSWEAISNEKKNGLIVGSICLILIESLQAWL